MKKLLYLLPLLALARPALAQHTELIGRAGGNLAWFGGRDAAATSFINYNTFLGTTSGYTNSPYGSRAGVGFGLGGRVLRVTRPGVLLAFDLGYDWQQARTEITSLYYSSGLSSALVQYAANGSSHYRTQNISGFLGVGYRAKLPGVVVDALVGPELAGVIGGHEKGRGIYNDTKWTVDERRDPSYPLDARLRADLTAWRGRTGLNASYSLGFMNYQGSLVGSSAEVYARVLRLGLAYRLR
ncbi:hypothetical protein [Hymenobacter psoromatis]|uniref:hypothetical protein n=1 Tax=Hymenobacter psoromatis TaxID=1484116 RepID=UPI001CBDA8B7|nr:hypothetical protein [Hymenobacter psoromatis]